MDQIIKLLDESELTGVDLKVLKKKICNMSFKNQLTDYSRYPNLKFIDYDDNIDEWMCYEDGTAEQIKWLVDDNELLVDIIQHSSKHTYTHTLRITYNARIWIFSSGTYTKSNENCTLLIEDLFELLIPDNGTNEYTEDEIIDFFVIITDGIGDFVEDEEFMDMLKENYLPEQ
jgi:hypothetical protein